MMLAFLDIISHFEVEKSVYNYLLRYKSVI